MSDQQGIPSLDLHPGIHRPAKDGVPNASALGMPELIDVGVHRSRDHGIPITAGNINQSSKISEGSNGK